MDGYNRVFDEWIDDEINPAFSIYSLFKFLDCQVDNQEN
jgi:hypothetical protein